MENLRLNEQQSPSIDRNRLLVETQNRELNRLFSSMENNKSSVSDFEKVLLNIWENNLKARPYILSYMQSNSQNITSLLRWNSWNKETKENHEVTKKLNIYKNVTDNLKQSLNDIQNQLNESTSLSLKAMDKMLWLLTDDNVFNTYKSSFESIQRQASNLLQKIQVEINDNNLTLSQKQTYISIVKELQQISSLKLESTWIIQMWINEVKQTPNNIKYAVNGVKWEFIWLYEWTKAVITWSADLLTFMVKYPFSENYRNELNNQAEIVYNFVKKEWFSWIWNKVYETLWKEMARISTLPPEKQAEAIWEISWKVISTLLVIKASITVASKLWKVWQAEKIITKAELVWNIARAEKVRELANTLLVSKRWFQAFDIVLTWIGESVLLKWLWVSFKSLSLVFANNDIPYLKKIGLIDDEIKSIKELKAESPEETQILHKYIEALEQEKNKLSPSEIHWNITNEKLIGIVESEFNEYEYFQEVLKKFILDEKNSLNIVNYLKNPETRELTIKELKEILKLWEKYISQEEMSDIIKSIFEWESILLKSANFKRDFELKQKLIHANPELFEIGWNMSYNQNKLLKSYVERLNSEILPALKNKLKDIISDIDVVKWFPKINVRAKDAGWIRDKIWRMRIGNNWKNPRIDYNLSDMPDAVWWRITVTDINQLEQVMSKVESIFGKENIFEIDNFYSSAKKDRPYRVIAYTVLIEWVPCEIQLTTLKSNLVADIWHNTWYKRIHELPEEIIDKLDNLQRQATLYEHNLLK